MKGANGYMDIKHDLKSLIHEQLEKTASPIFLKRVLMVIEESGDDKKGLLEAAEKISKSISLFIDKAMAVKILDVMKMRIEKNLSE